MSTLRMGIEQARRLADGGVHTVHGGQVIPAARTIVVLSDRIAKLETELHHAAAHSLIQGKKLRAAQAERDRLRTELELAIRIARSTGCHPKRAEGLIEILTRILEGDTDES